MRQDRVGDSLKVSMTKNQGEQADYQTLQHRGSDANSGKFEKSISQLMQESKNEKPSPFNGRPVETDQILQNGEDFQLNQNNPTARPETQEGLTPLVKNGQGLGTGTVSRQSLSTKELH